MFLAQGKEKRTTLEKNDKNPLSEEQGATMVAPSPPRHPCPLSHAKGEEKKKKGGLRRVYFADVTLHALRTIKSVSFSKLQTAPSRCSLSEIKVQGWPGACGRKHLFRMRRD